MGLNIRVAAYDEYEPGEAGYVIERRCLLNDLTVAWAIPAWDEMGYPDLCPVFPTREAANAALHTDGL